MTVIEKILIGSLICLVSFVVIFQIRNSMAQTGTINDFYYHTESTGHWFEMDMPTQFTGPVYFKTASSTCYSLNVSTKGLLSTKSISCLNY